MAARAGAGPAAGGPVAITGANSLCGRLLLPRLAAAGVETWALVRRPEALPAARVVARWTTVPEGEAALREAAVIVHLAGELRPEWGNSMAAANVGTTHRVVRALAAGRARRVVYLSYLRADRRATNPYLRTKGEAEELLRGTGREVVVFRTATIVDRPERPGPLEQAFATRRGGRVWQLGPGTQRLSPVLREDVVEAVAGAIRGGRPGTYELAGPATYTADELVRLLNRDPAVRISHLPVPLLRPLVGLLPGVGSAFLEVALADGTGDGEAAAREFGFALTPLANVWR